MFACARLSACMRVNWSRVAEAGMPDWALPGYDKLSCCWSCCIKIGPKSMGVKFFLEGANFFTGAAKNLIDGAVTNESVESRDKTDKSVNVFNYLNIFKVILTV